MRIDTEIRFQQWFDKTRRNLNPQDRVYQRPTYDHQIALYKKAHNLHPGADSAQDPAKQSQSQGSVSSVMVTFLPSASAPWPLLLNLSFCDPSSLHSYAIILNPAGASVWIASPAPFLGLLPTQFSVVQCPGSAGVSLLSWPPSLCAQELLGTPGFFIDQNSDLILFDHFCSAPLKVFYGN